jgi:hypothetical protein
MIEKIEMGRAGQFPSNFKETFIQDYDCKNMDISTCTEEAATLPSGEGK